MSAIDPYDFSIVIEWENILLAEDDRCHTMLGALSEQLAASDLLMEILVMFNPRQVDRGEIDAVLRTHFSHTANATLSLVEAPDLHYYDLKNHGAEIAQGDVIIFLDTDVIIEDGWLEAITAPFQAHPEIQVVAGHTYLAHDTFVGKVFALGWFFPLRNAKDGLRDDGEYFFANNVAFRRAYFRATGFPTMADGMTRGACEALSKNIKDSGNRIYVQTAARAEHPPPSGARHLMYRALAHGRDDVFRLKERNKRVGFITKHGVRYFVNETVAATRKIHTHGAEVGLPGWQKPFAVLAIGTFYFTALIGNGLTQLFPNMARSSWRI